MVNTSALIREVSGSDPGYPDVFHVFIFYFGFCTSFCTVRFILIGHERIVPCTFHFICYYVDCITIQEEIKSRLKIGNACYHSVQNLLSSSFISKNLKIKIYRSVILPVVLYGCETWSLTLREEHRLRVLRRIFGPKRDGVTGEWRKLHNEELNDIIRVIKSRKMRWAEHVARIGNSRGAYRVLIGKPEGKKLLGRPRRRWEDNIKMDLKEVGCEVIDWIDLPQAKDRWWTLVNVVISLRVPYNRGNFLTS